MAQTDYIVSTTALSLTPSGTTVGSGNVTAASFTVCRTFTRASIGAGELASGSQTWTVHTVVSATTGLFGSRFRVQRLNSSGTVQSSSPYTTAHEPITTGTYDEPVTWDSGTWAANDQLALSWEAYRTSGTGNKTCTLTVNGSSYVVAPVPATTLFGASVVGLTLAVTDVAKVAARSSVAFAESFASATVGRRILFGASVSGFTLGEVVAGRRLSLGQSAFPLAFDAVTAGDIAGGGADWFGQVATPFALDLASSGHLALYARPNLDSVDGAWTTQDGGTDLEGAVDELVPSDADYIRSELHPADSACRMKLAPVGDPNSSDGHRLHWRIAKDTVDGEALTIVLALREGGGDVLGAGTLIASFTRTPDESFTSYTETIAPAQAAAISDYSDLYLELTAGIPS